MRPMKDRSDKSMVAAFEEIYKYLEERDLKPKLHVLDNECSKAVKQYIRKQKTNIQIVEPDNHRANAAEPAVKSTKYHFTAGLGTADKICPLQLWDRFLPQVQDTLNMLRTSRRNNKISAYEEMEGPFDFNRTPMAPIGTKAIAFLDPAQRASWQAHAVDVFYTGRLPLHYRLMEFFDPATRGYRKSGTYKLYPAHCKAPVMSEADRTIVAASDLMKMLKIEVPTSADLKCKHASVIDQLTAILENRPVPRVDTRASPRVDTYSPPRVAGEATTSTNLTDPKTVRSTRYVHQRQTRNNTPMPTIEEATAEAGATADPPANQASAKTAAAYIPTTRLINGEIIGSRRNHFKKASRKRIQSLVNTQLVKDQKQLLRQVPTEQRVQPIEDDEGAVPPLLARYDCDSSDDEDEESSQPPAARKKTKPVAAEAPENVPTTAPSGVPNIPAIPSVTQDECDEPPDRRRSPRFQQPKGAAFISQQALHFVVGKGLMETTHGAHFAKEFGEQHSIDLEEVCNGVVHPVTNETITKYHKLIDEPLLRDVWMKAMCIELGRLASGYKDTKGTETIKFLSLNEIANIPSDRTITYARIVVDYRAQKTDPNRVRITVGGNLIDYPFELTTRTADLTTSKVMWNSVISTPGARYACADVKNFYLCTPLDRPEYMRMPINLFPQEFIDLYNLAPKVKNGYVYMEINKGMYGLPQSGILSNKLLKERLEKYGYSELPHTPGLFKHETRPVWFTLVVDDFGIKYIGRENAEHLLAALKDFYEVEIDWDGELYCGITLKWNYDGKYVDISMPNYVRKQLLRYRHSAPKRKQNCPFEPNAVHYGKNSNDLVPEDIRPELDKTGKKHIQQVVGSFLYYARAVDMTILHALSEIASNQAKPTERTLERVQQFLDYMHAHSDAVIRFRASDMILNVHSDASYLTASRGRSRAGGYFFLGSIPRDGHPIKLNGNVAITCAILKRVAASAAEAELGALFVNVQDAKVIRLILEELGHRQPPIPVHIDNTTCVGIVNNTIKRQKSRSMEKSYFWLLDQATQDLFKFIHQPGQENLGDYPTKAHNGAGHDHARPYYIHMPNSPTLLPRAMTPSARRGCAELLADPYHKKVPLPTVPNNRAPSPLHDSTTAVQPSVKPSVRPSIIPPRLQRISQRITRMLSQQSTMMMATC